MALNRKEGPCRRYRFARFPGPSSRSTGRALASGGDGRRDGRRPFMGSFGADWRPPSAGAVEEIGTVLAEKGRPGHLRRALARADAQPRGAMGRPGARARPLGPDSGRVRRARANARSPNPGRARAAAIPPAAPGRAVRAPVGAGRRYRRPGRRRAKARARPPENSDAHRSASGRPFTHRDGAVRPAPWREGFRCDSGLRRQKEASSKNLAVRIHAT
jgi:hypothetical protein